MRARIDLLCRQFYKRGFLWVSGKALAAGTTARPAASALPLTTPESRPDDALDRNVGLDRRAGEVSPPSHRAQFDLCRNVGWDSVPTRSGQNPNRHNASLAIASFTLMVSLLFCNCVLADETPPKVRHVFVPAGQLELWPKGDWVPVPLAEYEELREATRPARPERRGVHIEWQSLSATFDAARGVLTDGRWSAEVRGREQPQLMSLEPLDLPLSELRWARPLTNGTAPLPDPLPGVPGRGDQALLLDAVWGTAPSGETVLLVESGERRLEGKFSRKGRRLPRTWQFDLRLATATVSELTFRVPAKFSLKCSAGQLRGPLSTGEEGWRRWSVNLGSQSRCEVLMQESSPIAPTEPVIVYEQTSSYVLREAEVELQCEINAEVFHTPKTTLAFAVPDDLTVYSVGFAGDARLPWRELPRIAGQQRQVEVVLPEPQIGKVRSLQILAGAAAKWEPSWTLPRIVLSGGWFTGGRCNVSVDAPLVWRALRTNGLRLTEVDANSPTVRRLSFLQYLAEPMLALDISYPEPRLTSHGLHRLVAHESEWRLTSEWHWQSTSGILFATGCRIPTGWEIVDVHSVPETAPAEVRHWDVHAEPSGERTLVCEFASPLDGRSTQRVMVEARRPRLLNDERDAFELPTPLDCRHADQLLAVNVPVGWKWDSADEGLPALAAMKRINDPWPTFELWKSDSPTWNELTLLSRTTQVNTPLKPIAAFVVAGLVEGDGSRIEGQTSSLSPQPSILNPQPSASDGTEAGRLSHETQLVWTSAELRSLIFPGGDGNDRHWLSLVAAQSTQVGRLEFDLPEPAELVSVKMNGVRAEPQREASRFQLPSIPQGGLLSLEIQYQVPSDRGFLRNRQTLPVPRVGMRVRRGGLSLDHPDSEPVGTDSQSTIFVDAPVLGFRWLFALPPDARLAEEPAGLRLLQPLDPTPWMRRLFGPLGRDDSSAWFNPALVRSWTNLWVSKVRHDSAASSVSTSFAPLGWRVREAVAPALPTEVTCLTWNASQVRILAWIGMLFSISAGCVLRWKQARQRVHVAAMWLGTCVVGVVLSAPVNAEVLGGCLIGTLIAVLIPRRLLMSYAEHRHAAARGAFDVTVAIPQAASALLLSLLLTWGTIAADEPKTTFGTKSAEFPKTAEAAAAVKTFDKTIDVLVPIEDPARVHADIVRPAGEPPLVFVPERMLERWREQRSRQIGPVALIAAARYAVDLDDQYATVQAEFLVHRLRPQQVATLRFPFVGVPLSGSNSCLLDGQPQPVRDSETRDALLVELPALEPPQSDDGRSKVVSQRVTFTLMPPMPQDDTLPRVKLGLPPILQSTVIVKSRLTGEIHVSSQRGESHGEAAAGTWSAWLGKISELSLDVIRPGASRSRHTAEAKVDIACLAEFSPTALRQRYRARYIVSSGELSDVAWLLPHGVLIREGEVQADELLQWSVERLGDGRQKLLLEFSKPQTGEFTVDIVGLQPPLGVPEQPHWVGWDSVPTPVVVQTSSLQPQSLNTPRIKLGLFALGVTGLPGFKVTAQQVTPEQTTPLTEAAFVKAWGNAPLLRQPQLAMQLSVPTELTFHMTPSVSQRKVRQELLLKLGRKAFEWELHAEVTTTGAPVFQHDITLAPHFRVDEVKVTEDEAERLVSWSTTDQRLTVFLRGATSGIQNVVLQGRESVPADGRLMLPTRWFADAELSDFSVRVTHDPDWEVHVYDDLDQPLAPVEVGGPMPDRSELFLGKFRAEANRASLNVRLTPHVPAGSAEAWTVIAPVANDAWVWRHTERLLDSGQITARVFWPTTWQTTGTLRLAPSLKELARRQLPDGFELTIQSVADNTAPRELIFEVQPKISEVRQVHVTAPTALDMGERSQHWLVAGELSSWLSPQNVTHPLTDSSTLPESVRRLLPNTTKDWLSLNSNVVALDLLKPEIPASTPLPKTVWMDTVVWVADGAISQGRTWLLLQPNGLRELSFRRSADVRWLALFVNDKLRDIPADSTGDYSITDLPNEPLVWISVFWQIDAAQRDRIVARRDAQLPTCADPKLAPPRHDLTLISAGHSDLSSTRGARRVQDWDGRLSRAANILRGLQVHPAAAQGALRRLWDVVQNDVMEARLMIDQLPTEVGLGNSARERLQAVNADFEAFKSRQQPTPSESSPLSPRAASSTAAKTTTPMMWTSDAWRQVPNSWIAIADADHTASLSVIVVDRRWLTWIIAVLAITATIPLLRVWLRWQTGEWLATHPYLAWASLGIIWWTFLAPSVIGFGLLLLAALIAARQRWHSTLPTGLPTH